MRKSSEIIYLLAEIRMHLESIKGLTLSFLPIKTTRYDFDFSGVTLAEILEKDLRNRLKGVQFCDISLKQVSQGLLEDKSQAPATEFIDYIFVGNR